MTLVFFIGVAVGAVIGIPAFIMKHWRHITTRLRSGFSLCGLREVDGAKFTSKPALITCVTCLRLKRLRAAVARASLTAVNGRGTVSGMAQEHKRFRGGLPCTASERAGRSRGDAGTFASSSNGRASAGQATDATEEGSGYGVVATSHGDEGGYGARGAEGRHAELRSGTEARR